MDRLHIFSKEHVFGLCILVLVAVACFSFVIGEHTEPIGYWFELWWLFPIAFLISLSINMIGISSAALFVPFFILIFPLLAYELSYIESVMVGLITESFGLASSALSFYLFGLTDTRIALYAIAGMLPFVFGGVIMATLVPESIILIMIAGLLLISAVFIFFEERLRNHRRTPLIGSVMNCALPSEEAVVKKTVDGEEYRYCRSIHGHAKRFFGFGIGGFFQGSVGFGAGELGLTSMMLSRIPTRIAIGTSHGIVAVTAISATLLHIGISVYSESSLSVPWNILVWTVPAVLISGKISPMVASKLPTKLLERFMAVLFLGIAVSMFVLALK